MVLITYRVDTRFGHGRLAAEAEVISKSIATEDFCGLRDLFFILFNNARLWKICTRELEYFSRSVKFHSSINATDSL